MAVVQGSSEAPHLKDGHAIVDVGSRLAVGEPVEETPKSQSLRLLTLLPLLVLGELQTVLRQCEGK